ncbi:hypothetical protein [Micromonospora sp. NBC_01813]|uniref:hypothetical protein n=1 Tax=Micromonospora sp. NBC_01813 TaxID=2975988 RepID=UPI002DDBD2F1|nr:hypothetical protein [Micromonospora sp. NBC_01813]WSA07013.1 hypothetical protein OG958_22480 [Micromonospora sp. NBC_01813]
MTESAAIAVGIILLAIALLHSSSSPTWALAKYRLRKLLTTSVLILAAVIILRHGMGEPNDH